MSLSNKLKESDNYEFSEQYSGDTRKYTKSTFINVIDQKSNTALTVSFLDQKDGEYSVYKSIFYFEIGDTPYWVDTEVDNKEELDQFKRDAEDFMVKLINKYES